MFVTSKSVLKSPNLGAGRYGFMFGRESARKDLQELIDDLRRGSVDSDTSVVPDQAK
ncbi:hypothetical protein HPP92_022377 [Vanilla planifolia]|uniref:Uncharacterized protein n=1 Tax=Vanilla planifolia TaxID=51239 RepID=A0A835PNF7_VANPL|nr:hypothetical protein HPP92_022377 [Vanilla planifolia]